MCKQEAKLLRQKEDNLQQQYLTFTEAVPGDRCSHPTFAFKENKKLILLQLIFMPIFTQIVKLVTYFLILVDIRKE